MMKKIMLMSVATVAILGLSACGGGGGENEDNLGKEKGYYLDSAVKNIEYKCGDKSGTTDIDGIFHFDKGDSCTFSYNGIVLRKVSASDLNPGIKIFEDNLTIARFLQSVDEDGISLNGITIPSELKDILNQLSLDVIPSADTKVNDIISKLKEKNPKLGAKMVSFADAGMHIFGTRMLQDDNLSNGTSFSDDELRLLRTING